MWYETIDILNKFKEVKGQRIVKKIPKLTESNLLILQRLTGQFNTNWSNIDPAIYFKCGIVIWKTFSYSKFLNRKILDRYIKDDKRKKRKAFDKTDEEIKNDIKNSLNYIKNQGFASIKEYSQVIVDSTHLCVDDYFGEKIDLILTAHIIYTKGFNLFGIDDVNLTYINNNQTVIKGLVKRFSRVIKKMEKEIL